MMHIPEQIGGTILLIDLKDRISKERASLEHAGFSVLTAGSVEEGLRVAREEHPDLVVAEVMLDKPDAGFVLGYQMKKDAELANIPLVLLSGIFQATGTIIDINSPEARQWIKADLYLERPFAAEHLLAKVNSLLLQHRAAA